MDHPPARGAAFSELHNPNIAAPRLANPTVAAFPRNLERKMGALYSAVILCAAEDPVERKNGCVKTRKLRA
jgi:hypothetical protein